MAALQVNSFERKTEAGIQVWYWKDAPGSSCGQTRSWRYVVQQGDTVIPDLGQCPEGYPYQEVRISGTPVRMEPK